MKLYVFVIISVLLSPTLSLAQNKVFLSESVLKKLIMDNPPNVQQIEASFLGTKQEMMAKDDQFGFRLDGEGQVFQSKERLLNNFDGGVINSSSSYTVGLTKPTRYGVDVGIKAFANKSTNAFVSDASTTGVSINLAIDLFQNLLGRQSHNDLKKSEFSVKRAELEKKSSLKTFESNTRKIYWSLVANNEQRALLESLVKSAEKQYKDASKRNRSGVADSGEVARYRSQWTTRKANLLSLNYQRSNLIKSLKELFPGLNGKEISLQAYSIENIRKKVLTCTGQIGSHKEAPFQFTNYDEIVEILNKEAELEQKVARTYGDPKVKLVGEYSSVGRDLGYQAAQDNLYNDPRARKSLGLQISIPIGSRTKNHSEVKEMLAKNRYQALAQSNLAKIKAYHKETTITIKLLQQMVKNQKDTNKSLETSLKLSRRKYKQARISLQELISEQDSHLQSQIDEINTNLTIINTLMDYFRIYGNTPCAFNRI